MAFSSLKKPVRDTFDRSGFAALVGAENLLSSGEVPCKRWKPDYPKHKNAMVDMRNKLQHGNRHASGRHWVADILQDVVAAIETMRANYLERHSYAMERPDEGGNWRPLGSEQAGQLEYWHPKRTSWICCNGNLIS